MSRLPTAPDAGGLISLLAPVLPSCSLSAPVVNPGSVTRVRADGLLPNSTVNVLLGGDQVASGTVNSSGAADVQVSMPVSSSLGLRPITMQINDSLFLATCEVSVVASTANLAPVARCQDVTRSAGPACNALVTADEVNNGSSNPEGGSLRLILSPSSPFALGVTQGTLTVSDAAGASSSCLSTIRVRDTTPPEISGVSANPVTLWPPNHKMVPVMISYGTTDQCGGAVACQLTVTSNEPVNGQGDGDMAPDWQVVDAHHILLRAERSGLGTGRIYTVTINCQDATGNVSSRTVPVVVPKSQAGIR
jgi:hypothetical protein